jgi:hypothetical protein
MGVFVGEKNFERHQNARYNNKKKTEIYVNQNDMSSK